MVVFVQEVRRQDRLGQTILRCVRRSVGLRKRYTGATGIEHQQFDRRVARTAAMLDAHHFGQRIALAQCAGGTALTGFDQQFAGKDIRRVGYGMGVPCLLYTSPSPRDS